MLTLKLGLDKAILLRDVLMQKVQELPAESRFDLQDILDAVNVYIAVKARR